MSRRCHWGASIFCDSNYMCRPGRTGRVRGAGIWGSVHGICSVCYSDIVGYNTTFLSSSAIQGTFVTSVVPEPGCLWLVAAGIGLAVVRKRVALGDIETDE